jgi:transposase
MQTHLDEVSHHVAPGAHALILPGKAGWHTARKLRVPANLTLLHLPPRSPGLNPTENVWQYLRQTWLSNRVFNSYEHICEVCCEAWNKLTTEAGRIASIPTRQWALIGQRQ